MKGRVKMFNEQRGFGFILGDDANDYFVHISDVKSVDILTRGTLVEFEPTLTERGRVAKSVAISKVSKSCPAFIEFGNTRIKLNNIKNYGISSIPVYYANVFVGVEQEKKWRGLLKEKTVTVTTEWIKTGKTIRLSDVSLADAQAVLGNKQYVIKNGEITIVDASVNAFLRSDELIICKDVDYLYVTTFQRDNYRFLADLVNFDVHKKCQEIDKYLL